LKRNGKFLPFGKDMKNLAFL